MKRVITLSVIAIMAVFALSACVGTDQGVQDINGGAYFQDLPDGRVVICAWRGNAISCDWENAKQGEQE